MQKKSNFSKVFAFTITSVFIIFDQHSKADAWSVYYPESAQDEFESSLDCVDEDAESGFDIALENDALMEFQNYYIESGLTMELLDKEPAGGATGGGNRGKTKRKRKKHFNNTHVKQSADTTTIQNTNGDLQNDPPPATSSGSRGRRCKRP